MRFCRMPPSIKADGRSLPTDGPGLSVGSCTYIVPNTFINFNDTENCGCVGTLSISPGVRNYGNMLKLDNPMVLISMRQSGTIAVATGQTHYMWVKMCTTPGLSLRLWS